MLQILPVPGLGEIAPGDDLAAMLDGALRHAAIMLRSMDVLVVTQKIVSKAEGRFVSLDSVTPSAEAVALAGRTLKDARLVELVLRESAAVVRAAPHVLITRTHGGLVMANAGIDRSNLGPERGEAVLLLPEDADASAAALRDGLVARGHAAAGLIVSDSFGRPWRMGVTNVAIGAAGIPALLDRRGEGDRDGRPLEVTQVALGDMVATAAALVGGEGAESIPAVVVRGLRWDAPAVPAAALVRPLAQDLFR